MNTPNQIFFPSINQYWWSSGTGNSRVVNLCDLFQVLQIVSKLSKWSWRGISSLWSSSALARKNVRHMLCRCLNWTLIQVRRYYEDTCMVAYWGGGGGQWLVCGTSDWNVWVQTLVRYLSVQHMQWSYSVTTGSCFSTEVIHVALSLFKVKRRSW